MPASPVMAWQSTFQDLMSTMIEFKHLNSDPRADVVGCCARLSQQNHAVTVILDSLGCRVGTCRNPEMYDIHIPCALFVKLTPHKAPCGPSIVRSVQRLSLDIVAEDAERHCSDRGKPSSYQDEQMHANQRLLLRTSS